MADWFRSPSWDTTGKRDFETRLARARAQSRPQYLRIKGLALRDAGLGDDAMQLFQRILDEYPDSLDARFAHELLGDGFYRAGRLDDAEREYRTVLETNPSLSATTGAAHLSLAEVLLDRQDPRLADEVATLLEASQPHLTFNTTIFRRYLLCARLAALIGDDDARRVAASRALELVDAPPQLARHPTVGLARPSSQTLHELEQLARP